MLIVKLIEPPCTERYARWCERSVGEIIAYLLLDSEVPVSLFVPAEILCIKIHFYPVLYILKPDYAANFVRPANTESNPFVMSIAEYCEITQFKNSSPLPEQDFRTSFRVRSNSG